MKILLDSNELPLFKKMSVKNSDAIATNRGQNGRLNADRSYAKEAWTFSWDILDIADYNIIKDLYNRQFSEGAFFRLQVLDTAYPIDAYVFIQPASIVPRFAGTVLEGYTLEVIQQ